MVTADQLIGSLDRMLVAVEKRSREPVNPISPREPVKKPCRVCESPRHTHETCRGRGHIICIVCGRPQRDHSLMELCGASASGYDEVGLADVLSTLRNRGRRDR